MKNNLLGFLGICKKAGKLKHGFDAVKEAVQKGGVPLVLVTKDISPKTKKEILFESAKTNTEVVSVPATMVEIEQKTGKRAGVLAVLDEGFAKAVKESAALADEEEDSI